MKLKKIKIYKLIFGIVLLFNGCINNNSKNMDSTSFKIEKTLFGKTSDGIEVDQFIMKNMTVLYV